MPEQDRMPSKRPWPITIWAIILAIGAIKVVADVAFAYGVAYKNYFELNPGLFAFFRPISWLGAALAPFGFWLMRRWGVVMVILINAISTMLITVEQPDWMSQYPSWYAPVRAAGVAVFLASVLPFWARMTWRVP